MPTVTEFLRQLLKQGRLAQADMLDVLAVYEEIRYAPSEAAKIRGQLNRSEAVALIVARDGWACRYCDTQLTDATAHVDHIHPVSRLGTNDPDNLCLACQPCNLSKGAKTVTEWRAQQ